MAITLEHDESVNSASMLTNGNLVIGVIPMSAVAHQKDHLSKHHLGQGKDEHKLYMQVTDGYTWGTSTMHVKVTTKGQEGLVTLIGDSSHLISYQ